MNPTSDLVNQIRTVVKEEITGVEKRLSDKITSVDEKLSDKIESVEHRLTDKIEAVKEELKEDIKNLREEIGEDFTTHFKLMEEKRADPEERVEKLEDHVSISSEA